MWRVAVLLLMVGCARSSLPARPGLGATPPLSADHFASAPSAVAPRRFTTGEVLYIRHCADCHGWEGRGNGPLSQMLIAQPPPLRHVATQYSEAEFVARVLLGKDLRVPFATPAFPNTEEDVTALLAHLKRLPTIPWEQAEMGASVYDALCVSCHGIYGAGDGLQAAALPTPPRDLGAPSYQQQVSDEELWQIIANGKGAMPGTGDVLTPDEIRAVIAFVRLLSPGYELYDRFCAACHGPDGVPDTSTLSQEVLTPEFVPTPVPRFDEEYFRTRTDDYVRTWIRHMLKENRTVMPHFSGELNAEEVRQIFTYLRSLPPES
ncbi:MAG: c-type cytochrome [Candidatus Binatia bacterium]|nr:c-type cytochrome [Candidatus Binatia bacterium]